MIHGEIDLKPGHTLRAEQHTLIHRALVSLCLATASCTNETFTLVFCVGQLAQGASGTVFGTLTFSSTNVGSPRTRVLLHESLVARRSITRETSGGRRTRVFVAKQQLLKMESKAMLEGLARAMATH